MKISVMMPTYCSESTVETAIKSVLSQDYKDIELLIADGGSSDGTVSVIERYRDKLAYFVSEQDFGLYDALNKCIAHANGDYVMMLAADDRLLKNAISRAVASMRDDTDVWCGMLVQKWQDGTHLFVRSKKDLDMLYRTCSLKHPATLFKRVLFDKYGGYDVRFRCSGDWEMFLRLYTHGVKFQCEDIPVALFVEGGISTATIQRHFDDYWIEIKYGKSKKEAGKELRKKINGYYREQYGFSGKAENAAKRILAAAGMLDRIVKARYPNDCELVSKSELKALEVE